MLKSALEGRISHIGDGGSLGQNGDTYSRQRPCCEKSQSLAQQDASHPYDAWTGLAEEAPFEAGEVVK